MTIDTSTCKPELREEFVEKLLLSGWKRVYGTETFIWFTKDMPLQ